MDSHGRSRDLLGADRDARGSATVESGRVRRGRRHLLLAHGGKTSWNEEVVRLQASVNAQLPVETAFGMARRRNIQGAVDRVVARGVRRIVAVPLFVSSHSSVIASTQYLLGLRDTAPADLAVFASMAHDHAPGHGDGAQPPSHEASPGTEPVQSPVPIRMTGALDRHPLVAEMLLSRALGISREPRRELVVLVAHGPVPEDDNVRWLADMGALAEAMRGSSAFRRIEYLTVRDDAPEAIRAQAAAELRRVVERGIRAGLDVLVVPLLVAYGGIEEGIRKRLEGLDYRISPQGLLPDERLKTWVLEAAGPAPPTTDKQ